jgi:hypothetical protein
MQQGYQSLKILGFCRKAGIWTFQSCAYSNHSNQVCALIESFFVSHPWIHLQYFGLQIQSIEESITLPLCNNWRDPNDGDECVKPFQPSKIVSSLALPKGKRLCTRDSSICSIILAWNWNQCLWVRTGYNSPHFILFSNGYFRINLWKFSCLCKHEYVISNN